MIAQNSEQTVNVIDKVSDWDHQIVGEAVESTQPDFLSFEISDEVRADWQCARQLRADGKLRGENGAFVAIYKGQQVDSGADEDELKTRLAERFGVPPGRFVVENLAHYY